MFLRMVLETTLSFICGVKGQLRELHHKIFLSLFSRKLKKIGVTLTGVMKLLMLPSV
jgi:hypothetical protein